jgi:F0F1-type ATP synthase assembly protein I
MSRKMVSEDPKRPKSFFPAGLYLNLGFELAVGAILGFSFGYYLDKKLHTTPLFLILGVFLGAAAGFLSIYRTVYHRDDNKRNDEKSDK